METESPEIIELLRRGDQQALVELWDRHRSRLLRLVKLRMDRRVQGRVDAEDVLQEAFVDFASRVEEYKSDPSMPFFLWLRYLTGQRLQLTHRHHLGTMMRDAGREVSIQRGPMPQATSISLAAQLLGRLTSVTQAVQRAEMQVMLQEAINGMDELDREILALRHFEELSNSETAQVLGIKRSTASSRHMRAIKRLKEILAGIARLFVAKRKSAVRPVDGYQQRQS